MSRTHRKLAPLTVLLIAFCVAHSALAVTTYDVTIDTSAVSGKNGQLAFDFTKSDPAFNAVDILNFSTDGTLGLPETQGGLVEGDLILGSNPAPHTRINGGFFFNELVLNLKPFGTSITFTLQLTENHTPGQIPDQFALFLLDESGLPLFSTSDPLGADALFAVDITGVAGGDLSVFSPTVFTPPTTLKIIVPAKLIQVPIDIKPGSFPNSINPSQSRGAIRVAILTTDTFDATQVDPQSVRFGPAEASAVGHKIKDADRDGDQDLVLQFKITKTGIECGDTSASLTGTTFDGVAIEGSDSIQTVGCK